MLLVTVVGIVVALVVLVVLFVLVVLVALFVLVVVVVVVVVVGSGGDGAWCMREERGAGSFCIAHTIPHCSATLAPSLNPDPCTLPCLLLAVSPDSWVDHDSRPLFPPCLLAV